MSQTVVVIFGSPADGWCKLSHCPMRAYGPFGTHEEAAAFAETRPEWEQPHVLLLDPAPVKSAPPSAAAS